MNILFCTRERQILGLNFPRRRVNGLCWCCICMQRDCLVEQRVIVSLNLFREFWARTMSLSGRVSVAHKAYYISPGLQPHPN